jgi:hypothetical protein
VCAHGNLSVYVVKLSTDEQPMSSFCLFSSSIWSAMHVLNNRKHHGNNDTKWLMWSSLLIESLSSLSLQKEASVNNLIFSQWNLIQLLVSSTPRWLSLGSFRLLELKVCHLFVIICYHSNRKPTQVLDHRSGHPLVTWGASEGRGWILTSCTFGLSLDFFPQHQDSSSVCLLDIATWISPTHSQCIRVLLHLPWKPCPDLG